MSSEVINFYDLLSTVIPTVIELVILNLFKFILRYVSLIISSFIIYRIYKTYSDFLLPFSISLKRKTEMKGMVEHFNPQNMIYTEKCPIPKILKPTQLLIKIYSASINPIDYKILFSRIIFIRWLYYPNYNIGYDISGIVLDVGEKVTKFKKGDLIYGFSVSGCIQEFTVAEENEIIKKPNNINFNEAASLPLVTLTAYQSLTWFYNKEDLKGKKLLVIGASGGTGHIGVQLGKYYQMEVYGVCSKKNTNDVLNYGALKVYNYDNEDSMNECLKEQFDLIFDTVSSNESIDGDQFEKYGKLLNKNGKYVGINGPIGKFFIGVIMSYFNYKSFEGGRHIHFYMKNRYKDFEEIKKIVEEGGVKPNINVREFNKDEVIKGFDELKSRRTKGKIVFEIFKEPK